eukprot:TRINITY_DN7553_c0_g1_i3.p1 TRINITY_DN7553_c0_g1~~TRINITY_DN7553_c0_g1_i3.p1  ORF type:complete len:473 (-),score=92.45 TRINITY_DN7553_c0_g1_i3:135-1553(-)
MEQDHQPHDDVAVGGGPEAAATGEDLPQPLHTEASISAAARKIYKPQRILLVIGGKPDIDWYKLFAGASIHNGDVTIKVEMAAWDEIRLISYGDSGVVVDLLPSHYKFAHLRKRVVSIVPDFLLVRSAITGVHGQDWRNVLYGFMHGCLPSINSLESLYICQHKPIVYGKLRELQKELGGFKAFPLIPQTYYANWSAMTFSTGFPLVAKVGTAHAGYGKMKLKDQSEFEDFQSVVALQDRYVTAEPFIDWDYDFRVQKIGQHYRAFRRFSTNWKGKGLNQRDEDIPVTPRLKQWVDAAARAIGMDICAMDGVHSKTDDKEYIIELNDSAIGLNSRFAEEDLGYIVDLVLLRMTQEFAGKPKTESHGEAGGEGKDKEQQQREGVDAGGGKGKREGRSKKDKKNKNKKEEKEPEDDEREHQQEEDEDPLLKLQIQLERALREKEALAKELAELRNPQADTPKAGGAGGLRRFFS